MKGCFSNSERGSGQSVGPSKCSGKHRDDFVAEEKPAFELSIDRIDEKAKIDTALMQPSLDVGIGAVQYFEVDPRIVCFERADDPGECVGGNTAERPDTHQSRFQAFAGVDLLMKRFFGCDEVLDERKQPLAVRRQRYAVAVTCDEGHAPFCFDRVQKMGDARLRVAGLLCGFREASEPHDFDKRAIASAHKHAAFS